MTVTGFIAAQLKKPLTEDAVVLLAYCAEDEKWCLLSLELWGK